MVIRKIKKEEIGFLSDMLYEALFVPKEQTPLPKEIIQEPSLAKYVVHWGKDAFDLALVSELDDELVGAVWGRLFDEANKGFGFVDHHTPEISMAVKSAYRNKGMGTALLKAIATAYTTIGIKQLSLSVDKANPAAHLYFRLGIDIVA